MENLTFDKNRKLDTTNFVRVGDLSYFEGPLLSLFEELKSGHFYLFDWVDRDDKFNRWIVYRVSPKNLMQFLNGELSHLKLFGSRPNDSIYFTDIDFHNKPFYNYDIFRIEVLPNSYIPNSDNFFNQSDCNAFEKIKSVVIDSLSRQKSENEYPKHFRASNFKSKEIKSIYFNRVSRDLKIIVNPITHSRSFNIEASNSGFKESDSIQSKEYANQYN